MSAFLTAAALLSGLGLFFIGVRTLSASLVLLVGRRMRAAFAKAMRGRLSSAISGVTAGLVTQSTSAVSWIIVSFVRGGVVANGPALAAPMWSNVGTALLPLIVAVDLFIPASYVIGLVGFVTYFKLARTDLMRNALEAALGAALLLFGMHLVSLAIEPVTGSEQFGEGGFLAMALQSPWLLGLVGAGFSLAAQSSSVAAAIAVAALGTGLIDMSGALPLILGANAAAIVNNALLIPGESAAGRIVFALQVVQKAAGSILLLAFTISAAFSPERAEEIIRLLGDGQRAQLALIFIVAQLFGALVTVVLEPLTRDLMARLMPASAAETLAQPAFLLREALSDPTTALDLAERELARLSVRLPLLLDHVREEPDPSTPRAAVLREAGVALSGSISAYLTSLLDNQLTRPQVAAAMLLGDAASNAKALHESLAEFASTATKAKQLPTAQRLTEALHALMSAVADHAETLGEDEPDMVLTLLEHRDKLMEELRTRLSAGSDVPGHLQDELFRMTILFERIVWLARRLVIETSQAERALAAE